MLALYSFFVLPELQNRQLSYKLAATDLPNVSLAKFQCFKNLTQPSLPLSAARWRLAFQN